MSSGVNIKVRIPPVDVRNLVALMARARTELGKSMKGSIAWAGYYITRSLSASTIQSPRLRRVIRNPDQRWKTDARRAPYGVMAPKGYERTLTFKPIYRTGEFGKVRFFDKKSMSWFRHAAGGTGKWEHIPSGQVEGGSPDAVVPGIMTDKRRKIGRRGLAKRSWQFASRRITTGGTVGIGDVPLAATIRWSNMKNNPTLTIQNHLRYAGLAFRTKGAHAITGAGERAAGAMRDRIETAIGRVK